MEAFLTHVGVNVTDLFAGFCGGVVNAFVFRKSNPWEIIGSVVVGTCTAAFLGPTAPTFISIKPSPMASFIIGLAGMTICQGLVTGVKRLRFTPQEDARG